jgi:hypothetical protein
MRVVRAPTAEEQHSEHARLPVVLRESDDAVDRHSREQHAVEPQPAVLVLTAPGR